MSKTNAMLGAYLQEHRPNEFQAGRRSKYSIPDMIDRGLHNIDIATEMPDEVELEAREEDIEVEYL